MTAPAIEDLLRELSPQVLSTLVRRHGQFEGCEDAVQEAVLAASVQWPDEGVPGNPRGWLVTVASRRLIDQVRSDQARREREWATATEVVPDDVPGADDTVVLLFLCCHPALTAASQTALTLRAVGGLTTAEIAGLLALMLLTQSRQQARTTAAGDLVPLDEQDRATWDRALIDEGTELVKASLAGPALGPYQLQAAIAATHADAATARETNWPQVHALYLILERIAPNPMVTLNRAIALAETQGPRAGLALLATLDSDERMARHHRLLSVRAHLLEKAGDPAGAYEHYRRAAKATASIAEQRYLQARASRVRP